MNRRNFILTILTSGVSAMILPSALTYNRIWIPKRDIWGFALRRWREGESYGMLSFCPIFNNDQFEKAKRTGNFTSLVRILSDPFYGKPNWIEGEPEEMVREVQSHMKGQTITIPEKWIKLYVANERRYDIFRDWIN